MNISNKLLFFIEKIFPKKEIISAEDLLSQILDDIKQKKSIISYIGQRKKSSGKSRTLYVLKYKRRTILIERCIKKERIWLNIDDTQWLGFDKSFTLYHSLDEICDVVSSLHSWKV